MIVGALKALFASFAGTWGFAMLLHAPKKAWLAASLIGSISFALYWVMAEFGVPDAAAVFAGAALGSFLAQLCARYMRMIATIFLTLSIVPMVPGLGLYRCMELLGQGKYGQGAQTGVTAMITIVMIAFGIGVGSFLARRIAAIKNAKEA